jgi:hypothetical protein
MVCMSFFGDQASTEPERGRARPHRPWDLPDAEFPGVVRDSTLVLGRAERVAVAITGLLAYSAGFEIFVTARVRPGADTGPGDRMPAGRGPGGARRSFRLGLQLADGTKVIGQHGGPGQPGDPDPDPDPDAEPAGPILRAFLAGGGPRSAFWRWWAWPLPPAGPVEFVCEWPAFSIPESRAGLDARLILDAAARSIRLWPGDEG